MKRHLCLILTCCGMTLCLSMISCDSKESATYINSNTANVDNIVHEESGNVWKPSKANSLFTAEEQEMANTAAAVDYMTDEEKRVVFLCNLARLDGNRFLIEYLRPYIRKNKLNMTASKDLQSLYYVDLKNVKNRYMLQPMKTLCDAAAYHAKDMGQHGLIGHSSSDGTDGIARIQKFVPKASRVGENCHYGREDALDIVIQLLIDENYPDVGHRKNILDAYWTNIGVSIQSHSRYRYNCVQDFCRM